MMEALLSRLEQVSALELIPKVINLEQVDSTTIVEDVAFAEQMARQEVQMVLKGELQTSMDTLLFMLKGMGVESVYIDLTGDEPRIQGFSPAPESVPVYWYEEDSQ
jgi:hypothetical protein